MSFKTRNRRCNQIMLLAVLLTVLASSCLAAAEGSKFLHKPVLRTVSPLAWSMLNTEAFTEMDGFIEEGIKVGKFPGAVVLVARNGEVVKWDAYGSAHLYGSHGQVVNLPDPMTPSTVFDLASVTKMFTATSIMQLVEQGKLDLDAEVASYMPEFAQNGKEAVTVRHLLTHTSGLPAWKPFYRNQANKKERIEAVLSASLSSPPGTKYRYSDLGLITLGLLVERVSGMPLATYIGKNITEPLGMTQTRFNPPPDWQRWTVATEEQPWTNRDMIWGEVHDENAWSLSGVAGHAGLFSTARDLAIFMQTILNKGIYAGRRILQEETVEEMLRNQLDARFDPHALGWELNETWYMGQYLSENAFGHTGYTGTSVVADPESNTIIIFLTNRVHPTRNNGSMSAWRRGVADLAALGLRLVEPEPEKTEEPAEQPARQPETVVLGVDALLADPEVLRGKRVGIITNPTGINKNFHSTVDLLYQHPEINLTAIFGPEHGFRGAGQAGAHVETQVDPVTKVPVYSLYGRTRKPTPEMLKNVDVLVFDIQDVGVHFYTYISTMAYAMQAAAENRKEFVVLDRPNPINGVIVEGPVIQEGYTSFLGVHPLPIRHGMTVGELACYFNNEFGIGVELTVIGMQNWQREKWYDETNLKTWVLPSPNMPSLQTATVYPGTCLLEGTNISEGRGTTRPFELIGAPYIDGQEMAAYLNERTIPGVKFRPAAFKPTFSKYAGRTIQGVQLHVIDRDAFRPVRTGIEILVAARNLYPDQFKISRASHFDLLTGMPLVRKAIEGGETVETIVNSWLADLKAFEETRAKYLIY